MKKLKNILLILIPVLLIITALIFYIQSYTYYADEWGTDISFDSDYLVIMIISVALLILAINKIKTNNQNVYYGSAITIGALLGFYNLGCFFKEITKNKNFDFIENQIYLYVGIIGVVMFIYFLTSYIDYKKNS